MVVTVSPQPTLRPPPPADLDGRVALVTGSSSGIGAAIATSLAQHGATVVVNSATSVAAGERLAAALPRGSYLQADVSNPDHAARLVSAAVDQHGRLDMVVNNAGAPQDVADTCLALIQARYSTGQIVLVDGGMALR